MNIDTTIRHQIKHLQDRNLLFVNFMNCNFLEDSNNVCASQGGNLVNTGTTIVIDCDYHSRFSSGSGAECNSRQPTLNIYKDDTEEVLRERLNSLAEHIEKYKDFVKHRADSPNFYESLVFSIERDKFDFETA